MKRHASLNRIYRLVWSQFHNTWIAVAENAKGRGKSISQRKLTAAALAFTCTLFFAPLAYAAPTGGQITAGTGNVAQAGVTTTITQQTQKLAIDWNTFSIASNEAVRFNQPNASAVALNRILSSGPSQIFGNLTANGQVFILNPNGVLFGQGAQVNVGGLVASTLNISNADFMAGNNVFNKSAGSNGSVVNQGNLIAANGGYIVLLGNSVSNQGVITATLGAALLAAGDKVTLNLNNGSLLGYSIDQGTLTALAENQQLIQADGGQVIMSAKAADALSIAVVNNTGIIEARTIQNMGGTIKLLGDMQVGQVNVGGSLDASAPDGGNGGFIETSAAHVKIADSARISTAAAQGKTGQWLIDPNDYTIAASGGDVSGSSLSTQLGTNNVTILSSSGATAGNGDINVNDSVSWSANTTLELSAYRNISVNANLTATGNTAGLTLTPNTGNVGGNYRLSNGTVITLSGSAPSLSIAGQSYGVINSLDALQDMNSNLGGSYALGSDIDASATVGWNGGDGFEPVGFYRNGSELFSGTFDGLGHTISGLTINRPSQNFVGLFGLQDGAQTRNIGIVNAVVIGQTHVGGLVGMNAGMVSNAYFTGSVSGSDYVGGLVGANYAPVNNAYTTASVSGSTNRVGGLVGYNESTVSNAYATGSVSGPYYVGGLVGLNNGTVNNAYASGSVSGIDLVGGLVGYNYGGTVSNAYATGSASGSSSVGGLVGYNYVGTVSNAYATGFASGSSNSVGGLVGYNHVGMVSNAYATGSVSGPYYVGGLVGYNYGGTISNAYASGSVSGIDLVGGLVGYNNGGTVSNDYATGAVSGSRDYVGGLVGYNNGTVSNDYATGTVSGSYYVGGLVGLNLGTVSNSFWDITASGQAASSGGVGMSTADMQTQANFTQATPANGSVNPGWDFSNTWVMYDGHTYPLLRSFMTPLTVTADNAAKTYDGQAYSGGNGVTYSSTPNGTLLGMVSYGGTSQGAINANSYTIAPGGLYSNQQGYIISYADGALTINTAPLSVTANSASKTYNGLAYSGGNGVAYSGFVNDETNAVLGGTLAYGGSSQGAINAGSYLITPSGLTSGNYTLSYVDGNLTVNPKALSAAITGTTSKVYDGTTAATIANAGYSLSGFVGTESATVNQTNGIYNSKNVDAATTVTASLGSVNFTAAAGTLLSNYILPGSASGAGTITPATLSYLANLSSMSKFSAVPPLSGTINGFVTGESLGSATTGTAAWNTTATSKSGAGQYPINGSGLTANHGNYRFVQAPGNATALTIYTGQTCKPKKGFICP